jgi:hypothetical protein
LSRIAANKIQPLKVFEIGVSDPELLQRGRKENYRYDTAMQAKELLEQFLERRMLGYETLDAKYGMVFDHEEEAYKRFENSSDDAE